MNFDACAGKVMAESKKLSVTVTCDTSGTKGRVSAIGDLFSPLDAVQENMECISDIGFNSGGCSRSH